MEREIGVKIFLNFTPRSTMDVQAGLDYYEERVERDGKVSEDIYKGRLIFSITERGKDGKSNVEDGRKQYLKGYMDKATAKVIFNSILQDSFWDRFGEKGATAFGGSETKNGKLIARRTRVNALWKKEKGEDGVEKEKISHYVITIEEGKGKHGKYGAGAIIDGDVDIKVQSMVSYKEALKMATEIVDYIRDEEIKHMLNGMPLYTIMYGKKGKYGQEEEKKEAPKQVVETKPIQTPKKEQKRDITDEEYIIPISGKFEGKKISQLNDADLRYLMDAAEKSKEQLAQEIYKKAAKEAKRRMGRAL